MNALYEVEADGNNSPSANAGQHGATCQVLAAVAEEDPPVDAVL